MSVWRVFAEGGGYLYRTGELLVAQEDLPAVQRLLREWGEPAPSDRGFRTEPVTTGSQWVRLTLGVESTRVPRLVADLRALDRSAQGKGAYRVSPNHVLRGNSHPIFGGTPNPPKPSSELGPPPPGSGIVGGRRVRVAVLDTGEPFKHPWFNGRVSPLVRPGVMSAGPDPGEDLPEVLPRYAGHSTFVTGVVLQHAPGAEIVVDRILDQWGETTDADLAAALRRIPVDVEVVLVSAGGYTHDNIGLPLTEEALAELKDRNPKVQLCAPAGNGGIDRPMYPAAFNAVVAVAALGAEATKPEWSNYGSWVDACTSGVEVRSTFLNHRGYLEQGYNTVGVPPVKQAFDGWASWSGTCFAAARVTGAIAQVAARPGMDAAQAAFEVYGGGRRRNIDSGFDLGVAVFPPSWT